MICGGPHGQIKDAGRKTKRTVALLRKGSAFYMGSAKEYRRNMGSKSGKYDEDEYEAAKVRYCPFCGESVYSRYSDGTFQCDACGKRFGVTEVE